VTGAIALVNVPVMLMWAGFGAALRDALKVPGRNRVFNIVMGLLLAASVIALLRI
jgi:threonine/homoserine/homoserine lactone efflux protein